MFRFHASTLDDPQPSRLGSGDGVVVDPEPEPDDLNVVAFDRLIDGVCHLEAGAEHLHDADLLLDVGERVVSRFPSSSSALWFTGTIS